MEKHATTYSNIIIQTTPIVILQQSWGQELPCQDGSGNGFDQSHVQPAVNIHQDTMFGRGQDDGKVGCQPRKS